MNRRTRRPKAHLALAVLALACAGSSALSCGTSSTPPATAAARIDAATRARINHPELKDPNDTGADP